MNCTIRVAKTKALISFAVTTAKLISAFVFAAKLISAFVFAYADCWFSHFAGHIIHDGA